MVVVPALAAHEFFRFLTNAVTLEDIDERSRKVQRPPTAHRFQVDEMNSVLVSDQLVTDLEHDGIFGPVDVVPREPEDLASAQTKGQSEHVSGLMSMALYRAEELLRLVWIQAPPLAVAQFRSFCN